MHHASTFTILVCIVGFIVSFLPFSHGNMISSKILNVGEELQKETQPLKTGSCLYQIQGLESHMWYEVKISYPASIPASFSIQLKRGNSDLRRRQQRKLLNTEKLIFKTDDMDSLNYQGGMFVLVIVEPEGVVAIPNGKEREDIIFNIVCDELLLGIPHKAWWVVILVIICLGLALVIPSFLPSCLLQSDRSPQLPEEITSKYSLFNYSFRFHLAIKI